MKRFGKRTSRGESGNRLGSQVNVKTVNFEIRVEN